MLATLLVNVFTELPEAFPREQRYTLQTAAEVTLIILTSLQDNTVFSLLCAPAADHLS